MQTWYVYVGSIFVNKTLLLVIILDVFFQSVCYREALFGNLRTWLTERPEAGTYKIQVRSAMIFHSARVWSLFLISTEFICQKCNLIYPEPSYKLGRAFWVGFGLKINKMSGLIRA